MATRGRKVSKGVETKPGLFISKAYCNKCGKSKSPTAFPSALDYYFSYNGLFPYCKECVEETYDDIEKKERTLSRSILIACRVMNVPYDEDVVGDMMKEGSFTNHPISYYMGRIKKKNIGRSKTPDYPAMELTFSEEVMNKYKLTFEDDENANNSFWGDSFSRDDVEFLESQYSFFKETIDISTHAETTLLKQLCKKLLWLKDAEESKNYKDIETLEKGLQSLMKSLKISPSDIEESKSGAMKTSFGEWVQDIEEHTPASFMKEEMKEGGMLFEDEDKMRRYYYNNIQRPLENFLKGKFNSTILDEDTGEEINGGI